MSSAPIICAHLNTRWTFLCSFYSAAGGAWKSIQELRAFQLHLQRQPIDLIVFLNGLNDLTNGATAKTLYGEKIQPADGYHGQRFTKPMITAKEFLAT